jgi:hypothetical protein
MHYAKIVCGMEEFWLSPDGYGYRPVRMDEQTLASALLIFESIRNKLSAHHDNVHLIITTGSC